MLVNIIMIVVGIVFSCIFVGLLSLLFFLAFCAMYITPFL